jgi:hypothetical protein
MYCLACEMEGDRSAAAAASSSTSRPSSSRSSAQPETLASYFLPQLASQRPALLMMIGLISFWLQGCGIKACSDFDIYNSKGAVRGVRWWSSVEAVYLQFARFFKPSPHMVS